MKKKIIFMIISPSPFKEGDTDSVQTWVLLLLSSLVTLASQVDTAKNTGNRDLK